MAVHLHPQFSAPLDEKHVRRFNGRVAGVEVRRVLNVRELALRVAISLLLDGGRLERLGVEVGRCDQPTAGAEVGARARRSASVAM